MSVKRGVGVGAGVGVGVGVGVTFLYFLTSFFLSFSRNLHELCIVTIFSDIKEMKKIKKWAGAAFSHHPKQSCHISVNYRSRKFLF